MKKNLFQPPQKGTCGDNFFLLARGDDVAGLGRVLCRGIVHAESWTSNELSVLDVLDEQMTNYLLIVPPAVFFSGELSWPNLSNTRAILISEPDYRAPAIFRQSVASSASSGKRLLIHTCFDKNLLQNLPGGMRYGRGVDITVWNVEAVVSVAANGWGHVMVSKKPIDKGYTPWQIEDWSFVLRDAANQLGRMGNFELSNRFYDVSYAIGQSTNSIDFDPFAIDIESVEGDDEKKVFEGIVRKSLGIIISKGERYVAVEMWNSGLRRYLEELLAKLTASA